MLERLHLQGVGPARELRFEFASRINVITGDNGVGKSIVLDVAWWALTRTGAGYPVTPRRGAELPPRIRITYRSGEASTDQDYRFDSSAQSWHSGPGSPAKPGMAIYARADGGFSVWDPARNSWRISPRRDISALHFPAAFHFDAGQVWDGLREDGRHLCNGLIVDWVAWQRADDPSSPSDGDGDRDPDRVGPSPDIGRDARSASAGLHRADVR